MTLAFDTLLIANRGEIACRIIRTARAMGLRTVAVHSDVDAMTPHVRLADQAVRIGPAPATESYLREDAILEAARSTGAGAIHPGYGFLSERESFAKGCEAAGIVFVGPPASAIAQMGDKITSKKIAAEAGVSTVPGFMGIIDTPEEAIRIADEIGYPVMIKATAGGGGKGMRIAWKADEVAEGFARSRSEAASSFGDDRVFIEKFVTSPRHIEIQVLADAHGDAVYLGERECSIQRRNQKVVEEAPSPFLDEATRRAMGEQSVQLAKAVGYRSAGTVEFIVDGEKNFYFLEMNTRLQVEHPVTELITGRDLVADMLRIASGEPLGFTQDDVTLDGWAMESRVYAEDPSRGFLPSTGRLTTYRPPAEGIENGVTTRVDDGVVEGSEISVHYDPMIAKLVTHAPTRARAIDAQEAALDAYAIEGLSPNLAFLADIYRHERFRSGEMTTAFIAEEYPDGFAPPEPEGEDAIQMAAVALAIELRRSYRLDHLTGRMRAHHGRTRTAWTVRLGTRTFEATVLRGDGAYPAELILRIGDTEPMRVQSAWQASEPVWTGLIDGAPVAMQHRGGLLRHRGRAAEMKVLRPRVAELLDLMPVREAPDTSRLLLCPMPGTLVSIAIAEGQVVKAGERLAMVEAMKMENVLVAERDATVA
ncbi:MAG: acetyl/propionyl/methylcrotonyl-CoA carboxylase subunit alpha, partial [Pseudomonadota bacterium]